MSDTEHPRPSANVGYETSDVDPKTLLAWVLGSRRMIWLSMVAAWVFFNVLAGYARRADPKISPLAATEKGLPPDPRSFPHEPHDLVSVRREEEQVLDSYGWIDKGRGLIRIPIARAIDLVAKEGLPSRPPGNPRGRCHESIAPSRAPAVGVGACVARIGGQHRASARAARRRHRAAPRPTGAAGSRLSRRERQPGEARRLLRAEARAAVLRLLPLSDALSDGARRIGAQPAAAVVERR